jgi:hypothetical protein
VWRRQKLIKFNDHTCMAISSSSARSSASLSCAKTPFSSSSLEDASNYPPATAHSQYGAYNARSPMDLLQRCERVTALHCFYCGGSGRDVIQWVQRLVCGLDIGAVLLDIAALGAAAQNPTAPALAYDDAELTKRTMYCGGGVGRWSTSSRT